MSESNLTRSLLGSFSALRFRLLFVVTVHFYVIACAWILLDQTGTPLLQCCLFGKDLVQPLI